MSDNTLYTTKRTAQYRGPTTSDDYNSRIEENYKDLVVLNNRVQNLTDRINYLNRYLKKNLPHLSGRHESAITQLHEAIQDAEYRFPDINMEIDNDNFIGTEHEINQIDQLQYDEKYRTLLLPQVTSGSFSRLKYTAINGTEVMSSDFKVFVSPLGDVEDRPENVVDANDFYNAVISRTTRQGWELSSVVSDSYSGESRFRIYVTIPEDQSITRETNTIIIDPMFSELGSLSNVQYSTARNISFSERDNWRDFEVPFYPEGIMDRWIIPDDGQEISHFAPTQFSIPPLPITGIRFELSTTNFETESPANVYSHGLQNFDVRYNKYLDEGSAIFKIEAGDGTISDVEGVLPLLVNIRASDVPSSFQYQVIWETAPNSGVYTLDPVAFSERVWIKVTLRKTVQRHVPMMTGLKVQLNA